MRRTPESGRPNGVAGKLQRRQGETGGLDGIQFGCQQEGELIKGYSTSANGCDDVGLV